MVVKHLTNDIDQKAVQILAMPIVIEPDFKKAVIIFCCSF